MNAQQYVESVIARLEASDLVEVEIERDEDRVFVYAMRTDATRGTFALSAYRSAWSGRWNTTGARYSWTISGPIRKAKTRREIGATLATFLRDWRA